MTERKSYLQIIAEQREAKLRRQEELDSISGLSVVQLVEIKRCAEDPTYVPESLGQVSLNQAVRVARALGPRI